MDKINNSKNKGPGMRLQKQRPHELTGVHFEIKALYWTKYSKALILIDCCAFKEVIE